MKDIKTTAMGFVAGTSIAGVNTASCGEFRWENLIIIAVTTLWGLFMKDADKEKKEVKELPIKEAVRR